MKNFKFYFILILFIFSLIELLSFLTVQVKRENLKQDFSKEIKFIPEIINNYSEYIPHLRNNHSFKLYSHISSDENNLFFTTIKNFDKKNTNNILIQGDSWAETLLKKNTFFQLKRYSDLKNVGIINAGISSFSPSSMTSQLYILKKEYKIEPSIIISIMDQTDIGDELFRYKRINKNFLLEVSNNLNFEFQKNAYNNLNKKNFFSFKLAQYFYNYYFLHKNIYDLNNTKTINLIYKKIKSKFLGIPFVLYPLEFGINKNETKIIKQRIENYINFAFKNNELKMIYFVTHPHLKHVNGYGYKINISSIIDNVIDKSVFRDKIYHINFKKLNNLINPEIYNENDIFSHLKLESYSNYYLPTILKKINF